MRKKFLFTPIAFFVVFSLFLAFGATAQEIQLTPSRTEYNRPSEQHWQARPLADLPTDQIIVRYNESAHFHPSSALNEIQRMQALNAAAGVPLTHFREMSGNAHVLRLPRRLPLTEVRQITARLTALAEVAYAEPDAILQLMVTPNDPRYPEQWHYFTDYGINAPAAWDITSGVGNIVVAVLDTGITNHIDLAGRTVPGYDFITDTLIANDGNSRDPDPSDPGDWVNENECGFSHPFRPSSWHGTHVAGTIGAASNNGLGVAGVNWVSKILPVRVLGKCGGYTSDIVDGMRWAAGLPVSGVPNNDYPAKVLNLSLGGPQPCSSTFQDAINNIVAAGATVVVSAGNDNANVEGHSPADCVGVITVAATDRNGNRAPYSNYGPAVEISAPGGTQTEAESGVLSTLNSGSTTPTGDTYGYYVGTSMAAPHVAGVASLLLSLSPSLTPAQVQQIIQNTAKPFPGSSTCNTLICGAGILDAGKAVAALPRLTSLSPARVNAGSGAFTLTVYGANFTDSSMVLWNDSSRETKFINSGELQVNILASDVSLPAISRIAVSVPHPVYDSLRTAERTFVIGSFINLPLIQSGASPTSTPTPSNWVTILNEDFEGNFPGLWQVFDNDGSENQEYYWAKSPCRFFAGAASAWAVGGGVNGSAFSCGVTYPDYTDSWMVYGPFSLQDATAAEVTFKLWLNSEGNNDYFCRLASLNNQDYYGICASGSTNGAWIDVGLDLSNIYTLGDLRGESQVWIALIFKSNNLTNYVEGAYVDNLLLRKCTAAAGCSAGIPLAYAAEYGQLRQWQAGMIR